MGNLLRVLTTHSDSPSRNCDIFVDFESAQPSESEYEVWTKVEAVFRSAESIILELSQYRGATDAIRNAISNPRSTEYQDQAWKSVTPLVLQLKRYYEFSLDMGTVLPDLLRELCSNNMTPRNHFETQQALFKQFAEILDFVLKFDDLKMTNPSIQNDFSYYRRTLSKSRIANSDIVAEQVNITNEMANRMSLFYADATPMLKSLGGITTRFVSQHRDIPIENTTDCLSTMASICRVMIENPSYIVRFQNDETKLFCLRVMVGAIILYDHVHPIGAFAKTSGIETKSSIKLLKDQQQDSVEGLLNALRYSTKHLNDESTPKAVKMLLA